MIFQFQLPKFHISQTRLMTIILFFIVVASSPCFGQKAAELRKYYREPLWKPRTILPYEDAISNTFWPASPQVPVKYEDPGFSQSRLSPLPAPGVHPRVLITPTDLEIVRRKLSLGDAAPVAFKVMWQRVAESKSAFFALVTNNDSLGRLLAADLVGKAKALGPKIMEMDKRADRDNLWNVERSMVAEGNPDPPTEIWDLLQYDYLHKWMTPEERELIRKVIARVCNKRISNFLHVPDHFMINNHEEFGMEYLRLLLLIEGEPGFDEALFKASVHKVRALLDWFLDKDGMCYESIKGWLNISAFVAVGLRDRQLLKHDHLQAKMRYFQAALRWEDGSWKIRDEMRASAFHVIWMMHYFHPADKGIDLLYQSTFSTHPFLTDFREKWPDPVGICHELLLLFADDGMQPEGKAIDWKLQSNVDKLKLPKVWQDDLRGYVEVRNSWRKEDLHVGFVCKQDFFYGGHEGSENNRITVWKDGVNWIQDNNMLADKATFLQNMLTVDGKGQRWPPAPGNWLGVKQSDHGLLAAGDGRIGYSFSKIMQVHPFSFPSTKTGYLAPFAEGNVDMSRDIQVAFQPSTIKYYDGYGHTDYGPWSGETRLIEGYKPFNPMQQAFRTVQVAMGKYPYVLVVDDAQKDDAVHHFSFNLSVPTDAVLVEAATPEIVFQQTDPSAIRMDDLILGKGSLPKDPITGKYLLKKGDPLCLIRVLWRNTNYGFPVPHLEFMQGHAVVTIPAISVSPEFRVMIYPYRYGDPLPKTTWNNDRSTLNIQINEQKDAYHFAKADGGRSVLAMQRDDRMVLSSEAVPARPEIVVRGDSYVASDFRYTRNDGVEPVYLLKDSMAIAFAQVNAPAKVVYTLDGSEPNSQSAVYSKRLIIHQSCTLKARIYNPSWLQGGQLGDVISVRFNKVLPAMGKSDAPAKRAQGLDFAVFEIDTKMYDDKGFFRSDLSMLPDLRQYTPMLKRSLSTFHLPMVTPQAPMKEQRKGFYQFRGEFFADKSGVYRFDLESCGPVSLDIASMAVIESTGVFHQQLAHRKGEIVLGKGWHAFELVVCDPLFWNINSLPPMTLALNVSFDEESYRAVPAQHFRRLTAGASIEENQASQWINANSLPWIMENGMLLSVYDRTGKRRDPDFLDIDGLQPFFSGTAQGLEPSSQRETVRAYDGYLQVPEDGIYSFLMPYREGENAWLGSNQASCQSQLRVGGKVVLQRGVPGRNLEGKAHLKKGWHKISLRFGTGSAEAFVVFPDSRKVPLNNQVLFRPLQVSIEPEAKQTEKNLYEVYAPTPVSMRLPNHPEAKIFYTLDGTMPTMTSQSFEHRLIIDKSLTLTAMAFKEGKAVTYPVTIRFSYVKQPKDGSLGIVDFGQLKDSPDQENASIGYKVWTGKHTQVLSGPDGKLLDMPKVASSLLYVDINVARGGGPKAGFKLYGIKPRENALTVALWFRTFEKDGKLFGKDGINAFGKSYRTVSCGLAGGKITANPGRLTGGSVVPGQWHFLVLSASEQEVRLYLDGSMVASGPGSKDIQTDALDFFTGHHAQVRSVQLFDRMLEQRDVEALQSNLFKNNLHAGGGGLAHPNVSRPKLGSVDK